MKVSLLSSLLLPATASARFIEANEAIDANRILPYTDALLEEGSAPSVERFLIELSPGETRYVTEDEKWELRRAGKQFMDITDHGDLGTLRASSRSTVVFPKKVKLQDEIKPLLANLSKTPMQQHLEKFTSFHTRYYKSDYGRQSSEWLLQTVQDTIKEAGADKYGVKAEHFKHSWGQHSIIATIPGKSSSTVVIGAHQDSVNMWLPSILAAPGADDDGSGTVTILEAFRVLLSSEDLIKGNAQNTIEFHWYSAEEGGLLGSQAIFSEYERKGRDVKAMLQQDMTGFIQKTIDAGKPESVGVITDFVDAGLTAFIKKVIEEYCDIGFVETKCGYACSDHASASKAGYPSAFVIESAFPDSDDHIHGTEDLIKYLSFDHMLQHAKMTLGFVYELGFTDFKELEASEVSEL
ncbi:Zn-dependent exopeptidase [Xylaria sp. FL1777]|nr:Zn-dependent exopeptidase [Xylaria sp. FL1777]